MDPYPWIKWLHVLSSTVLFGTGLGTALHMLLAHRSRDVRAIAVVTRNVVRADWLCILPSGIVQPLTGAALVYLGRWDPAASWLVVTYGLFALAGGCWIVVVFLQLRLRGLAAQAAADAMPLPPAYHRLFAIWFALGWPAFLGLAVVFALMVLKPG
jgi:uncharacterized membrane protein